MKYEDSYQKATLLKANISSIERDKAKVIAKSKGLTFQGWLGQLVKRELEAAEKEASIGR